MKFFFSAGEPSGDQHAAGLIEAIREQIPDAEFFGYGGPQMRRVGCRLIVDLTQFAVMWVWQVVKRYFQFKKFVLEAETLFLAEQIDAVVLVDFPGFNWHIAKAAKRCNIPVIYYMPPQVWAWAQWRVKKMRQLVDIVLCALPFEYRWFKANGCRAVYIGHPFFEEIRRKKPDSAFLDEFYANFGNAPILTLLAGSRNQEIENNLDAMLDTVEHLWKCCPNVLPVFAAFNKQHQEKIEQHLSERHLNIPVFAERTTELIRAAECCLAVSGSVSLELLACNKPTVIYYKVNRLALLIQRFFRRTRFITLVNLLAADRHRKEMKRFTPVFYEDSVKVIPAEPRLSDKAMMLFPEFLTANDRSLDAALCLAAWFAKPQVLAMQKERLDTLLSEVDDVVSPLREAAKAVIELASH